MYYSYYFLFLSIYIYIYIYLFFLAWHYKRIRRAAPHAPWSERAQMRVGSQASSDSRYPLPRVNANRRSPTGDTHPAPPRTRRRAIVPNTTRTKRITRRTTGDEQRTTWLAWVTQFAATLAFGLHRRVVIVLYLCTILYHLFFRKTTYFFRSFS